MSLIKKLLLLSLISLSAFSCSSSGKYFEGVATYELDYKSNSEFFTRAKLREEQGVKKLKMYKKGEVLSKKYNSKNELLETTFLDLEAQKFYAKRHDSDTVYWFDIRKQDMHVEFKELNDTSILDYKCRAIVAFTKSKNIITGEKEELQSTYFFAYDLPLNPIWYKDFKETNYNELIAYGKGLNVYYQQDVIYWEIFEKLKVVEHKKIRKRDLKFKLPREELLKEI